MPLRETAMKMLMSKLYQKEVEEREAKLKAMSGEKREIAWGSQIRNYVFQPYQLVKDLRTGVESTNPSAVLDGDLDGFPETSLAHRVQGEPDAEVGELD